MSTRKLLEELQRQRAAAEVSRFLSHEQGVARSPSDNGHNSLYADQATIDAVRHVRSVPHVPDATAMRALNISRSTLHREIKAKRIRRYRRGFVYSESVLRILDRDRAEPKK